MANKNYKRGYIIELKAKKLLEEEGYYVIRSSGSHTLFDLVAINKAVIRLIQLKRVKGKYAYFHKEIEELKNFKNLPLIAQKELWIWFDRKGFEIKIID